jgi:hypothetical protein
MKRFQDTLVAWLKQELLALQKATHLRTQDATEIVTSYLSGELSEEEAEERLKTYQRRWGEPIPGVAITPDMTDSEILGWLDGEANFLPKLNFDDIYETSEAERRGDVWYGAGDLIDVRSLAGQRILIRLGIMRMDPGVSLDVMISGRSSEPVADKKDNLEIFFPKTKSVGLSAIPPFNLPPTIELIIVHWAATPRPTSPLEFYVDAAPVGTQNPADAITLYHNRGFPTPIVPFPQFPFARPVTKENEPEQQDESETDETRHSDRK